MNKKEQKDCQQEWAKQAPVCDQQRDKRRMWTIEASKEKVYETCIADAILKYELPKVPAMDTTSMMMFSKCRNHHLSY